MGFIYDDDVDVTHMMEEPVAISRVRAFALAKGSTEQEPKVTLERARANLDRVKATREKHLKRTKPESFSSGHVDAAVSCLSSSSEAEGQVKAVKSKRFSVEKARAKLESVKTRMESDKSEANKPVNMYITSLPARASRKASKAGEDLSLEGIWVREAKVKLEAAREKKTKPNCKRTLQAPGVKKNVEHRSSSEVSCMERRHKGDGAGDGVKVTSHCIVAKEASMRGKRVKASKQKAVRASECIANSRLRTQQRLVALKVQGDICSQRAKLRRNNGNKLEESSNDVRIDSSGAREESEATTSDSGRGSSPAMSFEVTSSEELTPPAKRRKTQHRLVDHTRPPLGSRLSSDVKCVPPVSPYGLIQEHLFQDPWKVLVACILLHKTGGRQMHKVIWDLFELCPNAETCVSTETEKIGGVIRSLGLQNKRAKMLQRFSQDYLGTTWTNITQLHGIGEYARDAYAIFCEGRWEEVQPNDVVLNKYWCWLRDTQGLGYGFSQLE